MTLLHLVLLVVAAQRLTELWIARRNTARLLQAGAQEFGAAHYPLFILLHGAWLLSMLLFVPAHAAANPWLLAVLVLLLLARFWIMAALGPYWTTRIIRLRGAPIVRHGPYRWMRHPNYAIVVGEIAVLPLAFGAWWIAVLFSALNALLLHHRIKVENRALEETS